MGIITGGRYNKMMKNRWSLAWLVAIFLWAAVSAYFAYLHTFTIKTYYLDEKIDLGGRQFIVQEINAFNFESVIPDSSGTWWIDVISKLPVSLQRPFYEIVNFYSRPGITYKDTWEVDVKGVAIPRLPERTPGSLSIYIDGHLGGQGASQPDNDDYTFFSSRGDCFSPEDINQAINLILEDKDNGQKAVITLEPQWEKKYYFMRLPRKMGTDPANIARRFFELVVQGKKSEALKLVIVEKRNEFNWPSSTEIWNQMSSGDNLSYSLERQEKQGKYPVIYSLTMGGIADTAPLTVKMIKNRDHYEMIEFM